MQSRKHLVRRISTEKKNRSFHRVTVLLPGSKTTFLVHCQMMYKKYIVIFLLGYYLQAADTTKMACVWAGGSPKLVSHEK